MFPFASIAASIRHKPTTGGGGGDESPADAYYVPGSTTDYYKTPDGEDYYQQPA